MVARFGGRNLNLAQQAREIRAQWPGFKVEIHNGKLIVRGGLRPKPMTRLYRVRVEYRLDEPPATFVESPALHRRRDRPEEPIPHTYDSTVVGDERPCVFFPSEDWHAGMLLSRVLLWLASWLIDYELWHATGDWAGGGVPHGKLKATTVPTVSGGQ